MILIDIFLVFFLLNRINISRKKNEINWCCIFSTLFGLSIANLMLKVVDIIC